jgi:hypothetical protein
MSDPLVAERQVCFHGERSQPSRTASTRRTRYSDFLGERTTSNLHGMKLKHLRRGLVVKGIEGLHPCLVVHVTMQGEDSARVLYERADGTLGEVVLDTVAAAFLAERESTGSCRMPEGFAAPGEEPFQPGLFTTHVDELLSDCGTSAAELSRWIDLGLVPPAPEMIEHDHPWIQRVELITDMRRHGLDLGLVARWISPLPKVDQASSLAYSFQHGWVVPDLAGVERGDVEDWIAESATQEDLVAVLRAIASRMAEDTSED